MNILFVHANGIVPTAGGISRTTANLGQLFRKHKHRVWFVGAKDFHHTTNYDVHQSFLPTVPANAEENINYLSKLIEENDIRIIVNQAPFMVSIVELLHQCSMKTNAKIVSCYHNSILTPVIHYAYCHEYQLKQRHLGLLFHAFRWKPVAWLLVHIYIAKWRKVFRQTVEKSNAVVLLCNGQVDELLRMCGYNFCHKAYVIPNCMPITENGHFTKEKHVVWTGTFDYAVKRPDLMLRIWQQVNYKHQEWKLYMLGDGPSLEEMKIMSNQMALKNVVFTGRVKPDRYYETSMIQCMTSVHEAFPMVVLEAMSHNAPVIAFNSFTAAETIINNKTTGVLIEPFNIKEYAEQLNCLLDNIELLHTLGLNARNSVSRFSEQTVYSQWQQLFEKL